MRRRPGCDCGRLVLAMPMLLSLEVTDRGGNGPSGPSRCPDRSTSMPRVPGIVPSMLRIYLGHGASGSAASMAPWIEGLRDAGYEAHAVTLPRRKAEDAIAAFESQVPDEPGVVVGGHSFGGRVASLSAAGIGREAGEPARRYAGLVCLSYPLHRPGAPDTAAARIAHWSQIEIPALLLSGAADPFARIDLLETSMPMLARGRLETWPKLGHGLLAVREAAIARIVAFLGDLDPAAR